LTIDLLEIRNAGHLLSSTTSSYLIYVGEDGQINAVVEQEDTSMPIDWTTSPKYMEARMSIRGGEEEDEEDDEMQRGSEVIAKLCTCLSKSSLQMAEKRDGKSQKKTVLHPLMERLQEISKENGGDVTYRAVKALLVSEFTQAVFDTHKAAVRWELEHMAQYVDVGVCGSAVAVVVVVYEHGIDLFFVFFGSVSLSSLFLLLPWRLPCYPFFLPFLPFFPFLFFLPLFVACFSQVRDGRRGGGVRQENHGQNNE
jgi:hypothetical protein